MKRKRGIVLTPVGLKRLQAAIQQVEIAENNGDRFTLEELSDRSNLSTKTLSRLWSLNSGVDQKTIKLCFSAFNLELRKEDYITLSELEEPELVEQSKLFSISLSYPDGPVALDSPLYIERPPIETLAYQEITQPGCVIRIRAPKQMGKSSLMLRLLNFAEKQGYHTVSLDFNQIDSTWLNDLNKFLRGLCLSISRQLGIDPHLDDYWDEDIGSKLSCSFYLRNYLLEQINSPLVLVLNATDQLFEYPQIAQDFFPLLRSWYEESRRNIKLQKLRLVVVYSTEEYVTLDINSSPFNIGLPLHLPEFNPDQVQDLAQRHGLKWSDQEVTALMQLVGGHPSLVRIALYHICTQRMSLNQLLQQSISNENIFHTHLWRQWITLQKNPDLVMAMDTIISTEKNIYLDPIQIYKLESQGLIRYDGNQIKPRCKLYYTFFRQLFSTIWEE